MKTTHKTWYAVMHDMEDSDWGYGSHNKRIAAKMLRQMRRDGYPDAFIDIVDEVYVDGEIDGNATISIGRIHDVRGI